MLGLRLPRESRVSGVAATRLTAVPRDNRVTASEPRNATRTRRGHGIVPFSYPPSYSLPLDLPPFDRLMTRKHDRRVGSGSVPMSTLATAMSNCDGLLYDYQVLAQQRVPLPCSSMFMKYSG